ncbi:MAG: nucleotidyl transferase AbiEii/AbiGii toxin family protein [Clostridia bacterium]|nr:nucleotidyl transferase AbiEii/AbiGii toxin family protein [Clostridia bacterium]
MELTNREELMYELIEVFAQNHIPFVFKGGLITKQYLSANGLHSVTRHTVDIDANLFDKSIYEVRDMMEKVLEKTHPSAVVKVEREPRKGMTGSIEIFLQDTMERVYMDIDTGHPVTGIAELTINGTRIECVDIKQIIADKLSAVSSPQVFRRSKDFIDLYGLSRCAEFTTAEIREILRTSEHELGDFSRLFNERENAEHAYQKLYGVIEKPPFSEVYDQIRRLAEPFVREPDRDLLWDPVECDYSLELDRDDYDDPEEDLER